MKRASLSILAAAIAAAPALAQEPPETEQASFDVETVAEGLSFPWSLAFLPDGAMLVTERDGRLRVVEADGTLREDPVAGLPDDIVVINQGGLLEVALHPEFEDNRLVYFSYAEGTEDANRTALARGRLNAAATALEDVEDIFHVNFDKRRGLHYGGRILFEDSNTLFLTLGEGALYPEEAQNPENHMGTVVRLNDDGSVPADNPFVGEDGRADEIWTWGHRNVQGIDRNPETGSIWIHEHGARGGDEINILHPGDNYGWPEATYGINYDGTTITEDRSLPGVTEPIWYWVPSIAPAGMAFYTGDAFEHWDGDLFVAALVGMQLQRFEVDGDRVISIEPLLEDLQERFRYVKSGPDGALYVLTDSPDGRVLRLVPSE